MTEWVEKHLDNITIECKIYSFLNKSDVFTAWLSVMNYSQSRIVMFLCIVYTIFVFVLKVVDTY